MENDKYGTTVIVPTRQPDQSSVDDDDHSTVTHSSRDSDNESDNAFLPSVSDSDKQANMQVRVRRKTRIREDPKELLTKAQALAESNQSKIDKFCQYHLQAMSKGNRERHYVRALMACQVSARATVWQKVVTPFLYTCSVMEISVFDWMSSSLGIPRVYVPVGELERNGWKIPKVSNISAHMRKLRSEAYKKFISHYKEEKEEMESENLVDVIEENDIDPTLFKVEVVDKCADLKGIDMQNGRKITFFLLDWLNCHASHPKPKSISASTWFKSGCGCCITRGKIRRQRMSD